MVELQSSRLDAVFHALADPTRRAMLTRLADGEATIGDLARPFEMSFAGASKHVKVLEGAGLVRRAIEGRTHRCRLQADTLKDAQSWIARYERFWTGRLDVLEGLLREEDRKKEKGAGK